MRIGEAVRKPGKYLGPMAESLPFDQSLLESLIGRCELSLRKDASGWQLSAKGPLPLFALAAIAMAWHWH